MNWTCHCQDEAKQHPTLCLVAQSHTLIHLISCAPHHLFALTLVLQWSRQANEANSEHLSQPCAVLTALQCLPSPPLLLLMLLQALLGFVLGGRWREPLLWLSRLAPFFPNCLTLIKRQSHFSSYLFRFRVSTACIAPWPLLGVCYWYSSFSREKWVPAK